MARLLLVDDEPDLLSAMTELLQAAGHAVVPCGSGFDAMERIAAADAFDVAVLDWALPGVNGRDLVVALGARQPATAVVVVTGYGENVVSDSLQGQQVRAVLRKPFRMRELVALVASLAPDT